MPSSRGSSQPRDRTHVSCLSCIAGRFFYPLSQLEIPVGTWANANPRGLRIPLCPTRQNESLWKSDMNRALAWNYFTVGLASLWIHPVVLSCFLVHIWNKHVLQWENSQIGFHVHGLRVIMAGRARCSPLELSSYQNNEPKATSHPVL